MGRFTQKTSFTFRSVGLSGVKVFSGRFWIRRETEAQAINLGTT
jgi:hypothetical protein